MGFRGFPKLLDGSTGGIPPKILYRIILSNRSAVHPARFIKIDPVLERYSQCHYTLVAKMIMTIAPTHAETTAIIFIDIIFLHRDGLINSKCVPVRSRGLPVKT